MVLNGHSNIIYYRRIDAGIRNRVILNYGGGYESDLFQDGLVVGVIIEQALRL